MKSGSLTRSLILYMISRPFMISVSYILQYFWYSRFSGLIVWLQRHPHKHSRGLQVISMSISEFMPLSASEQSFNNVKNNPHIYYFCFYIFQAQGVIVSTCSLIFEAQKSPMLPIFSSIYLSSYSLSYLDMYYWNQLLLATPIVRGVAVIRFFCIFFC